MLLPYLTFSHLEFSFITNHYSTNSYLSSQILACANIKSQDILAGYPDFRCHAFTDADLAIMHLQAELLLLFLARSIRTIEHG